MNPHIRVKGFSLVEVMIALFILAVGILGIMGLQIFAKQSNYDAIQRTTAAALVTDIAERMRINNSVLEDYASKAEPVASDAAMPTSCSTVVASGNSGCTANQVATRDIEMWYSLISGVAEINDDNTTRSGGLVAPSACIVKDPNGTGAVNQYRIAIAWRGRTALSNPASSPCGEAATGKPYGANNEFRRVFVMDVFINPAST
jgi:type IV pilus assembly protein PilV